MHERLVDRRDDGFAIRRLGALLLAKRLDDFPDVSRKASRVVVYTGTSKLDTRIDLVGQKGYAVGYQGLVEFVMAQLPQNEVIEDALRREVKLVPEVVVRELVANALIHQDLTIGGASVMVEVYGDRVEFSNPGEPIVPVERFIDGYQSRNERLADLMRRMHICEEKSSGIDRVIEAAEVFQLPAPDFRVGHRRTIVTIFGPRPFAAMVARGSDPGVLPARRAEVGHGRADDQPVAARLGSTCRRASRDRLAGHCSLDRGGDDQARRSGWDIQEVRPIPAVLGMSSFKRSAANRRPRRHRASVSCLIAGWFCLSDCRR